MCVFICLQEQIQSLVEPDVMFAVCCSQNSMYCTVSVFCTLILMMHCVMKTVVFGAKYKRDRGGYYFTHVSIIISMGSGLLQSCKCDRASNAVIAAAGW